jgi:plastocyanin
MRRSLGRPLAALAVLLLGTLPAAAGDLARIDGRLSLAIEGASIESVAPVVVYLEPLDPDIRFEVPAQSVEIRQEDARFVPPFRAVVVGQAVEMPNRDRIFHNVFSYSKPNDFDLGTYPAGESRTIRFQHPGVVRAYCSIHERMSATVFVSPTPWFAIADSTGRYAIPGVPAGRYKLRTWAERLPPSAREISLAAGRSHLIDVELATAAD